MVKHVRVKAQQLRELGSGLAMLLAGMWNNLVVGSSSSSSSSSSGDGSGDMFGFLTIILCEAERADCANRWEARGHA